MATFYNGKVVTDGLVLALDAGNIKSYPQTGTTWNDVSGNNNGGSLINGPTFNSENGGNIVFDGVNDYVNIPRTANNNMLNFTPLSSFTMTVWAKVLGLSGDFSINRHTTVFGRGDTAGSFGIGMRRTVNNVFAWFIGSRAGAEISTTIGYTTGRLDYITFSYTPTFQKIYLNGILNITQDVSAGATGSFDANDYVMGLNRAVPGGNGAWMQGNIYYASMYNRELTETEVLQNFNATRSRFGV